MAMEEVLTTPKLLNTPRLVIDSSCQWSPRTTMVPYLLSPSRPTSHDYRLSSLPMVAAAMLASSSSSTTDSDLLSRQRGVDLRRNSPTSTQVVQSPTTSSTETSTSTKRTNCHSTPDIGLCSPCDGLLAKRRKFKSKQQPSPVGNVSESGFEADGSNQSSPHDYSVSSLSIGDENSNQADLDSNDKVTNQGKLKRRGVLSERDSESRSVPLEWNPASICNSPNLTPTAKAFVRHLELIASSSRSKSMPTTPKAFISSRRPSCGRSEIGIGSDCDGGGIITSSTSTASSSSTLEPSADAVRLFKHPSSNGQRAIGNSQQQQQQPGSFSNISYTPSPLAAVPSPNWTAIERFFERGEVLRTPKQLDNIFDFFSTPTSASAAVVMISNGQQQQQQSKRLTLQDGSTSALNMSIKVEPQSDTVSQGDTVVPCSPIAVSANTCSANSVKMEINDHSDDENATDLSIAKLAARGDMPLLSPCTNSGDSNPYDPSLESLGPKQPFPDSASHNIHHRSIDYGHIHTTAEASNGSTPTPPSSNAKDMVNGLKCEAGQQPTEPIKRNEAAVAAVAALSVSTNLYASSIAAANQFYYHLAQLQQSSGGAGYGAETPSGYGTANSFNDPRDIRRYQAYYNQHQTQQYQQHQARKMASSGRLPSSCQDNSISSSNMGLTSTYSNNTVSHEMTSAYRPMEGIRRDREVQGLDPAAASEADMMRMYMKTKRRKIMSPPMTTTFDDDGGGGGSNGSEIAHLSDNTNSVINNNNDSTFTIVKSEAGTTSSSSSSKKCKKRQSLGSLPLDDAAGAPACVVASNKVSSSRSSPSSARVKSKDSVFTCPQCQRSYDWNYNLNRHLKYECGKENSFQCGQCSRKFPHKQNCVYHLKRKHKILLDTIDQYMSSGLVIFTGIEGGGNGNANGSDHPAAHQPMINKEAAIVKQEYSPSPPSHSSLQHQNPNQQQHQQLHHQPQRSLTPAEWPATTSPIAASGTWGVTGLV